MAVLFLPGLTQAQPKIRPADAVATGILYDLSVPQSGIGNYDGDENAAANTLQNWKQIYVELQKGALQPGSFERLHTINKNAKEYLSGNVIPVGVLLYSYNRLGRDLQQYADENGNLDFTGVEIPEKTVFSSAAFSEKVYSKTVTMILPEEMVFSNFDKVPQSWYIAFDDAGNWTPLVPGKVFKHTFPVSGRHTVNVKAVSSGGNTLFSSFYLNVADVRAPELTATWEIESDIPYQGETTTGEVYIYLSDANSRLTLPVIISEGIEENGENGWEELYDYMNQENLIEDLHAQGFDIVVLNYEDTYNYLQRNAFLMVKLLQMVNDTILYQNKVVTVGPSMGGLIVRYALTYMESNGLDHNSGLFISFDAPNRGADIPLGLQYMMDFFKEYDAGIQEMVDKLNEPSPRQMLVYHYTDPPSNVAGPDAMFGAFFDELENLGDYPAGLRKVAVSDGSGHGVGQPYNAGDQVISYNYSSFMTTLKANVWAVEDNATGQIFEGLISIPFVANDQMNVTVFSEKPFDNSPGGYSPTFAMIDSVEPPYGDIIALHDNHSYVPTVSALDIDTEDLFFNIAADPVIMQKTPFDSIYWCEDNYKHMTITPYLKTVIYDEIVQTKPERHKLTLHAGWNDISSFLDPQNKAVSSLTGLLGDTLIILQNTESVYWPGGGLNTIVNWDYTSGYFIKLQQAASLTIFGWEPDDKTITFGSGWNLFPVLSTGDVSISTLFENHSGDVIIIKEAVGNGVYWPEKGIGTLDTLHPGSAYLIRTVNGFSISY